MMKRELWLLAALVVLWGDSAAGAPWGPTRCIPIPPAMALCHNIGYTEMRLPNLLDHDTAAEAIQQSVSWLPLLARECHPDARLFLCSLFAPVCLDRVIYPCRSLCEAVQASCAPIMACYGYPWPAILHCGRFPAGHGLCVGAVASGSRLDRPLPQASCRDCELQVAASSKEVLDTFCASDFAVKVRLSWCNSTMSGPWDCDLDSRLEVLKAGLLPPTELAPTLRRSLQLDVTCVYNLLRGRHAGIFVLSGQVQDHRLLVTTAYSWSRTHRNLQLAVRRWHHHQCQE
ncbi:secreted frizzled-related protein 5-like [Ochotona princeps]|uniref:secreted frizzled-related protein 5-like n=1 Tax=Ochotona princeps TaxID=9978 RepID=UPI0027145BD3|nr:secreted frizzled-related protein 5-like [Ochotona princeps]